MVLFEQFFALYDIPVARALLIRADLSDRQLSCAHTVLSLLQMRIVPLIKKKYRVGIEETEIGDNANLWAPVDAGLLIMLPD